MLGRALSPIDPDAAVVAYRDALRLDSKHREAHADLSQLLRRQKQWDASLTAHLAWVHAFPNEREPYSSLARLLVHRGGIDWDQPPFREVLAQVPDPIGLRLQVAYSLSQEWLVGAAHEQYQQVLRLDPDNEEARAKVERYSRERLQGERLLEVLRAWLIEHPHDVAARDLLIRTRLNVLNDFDGALEQLGEAIAIEPSSFALHYLLSIVLWRKLGLKGAIRELEASVVPKYENAPVYLVLAVMHHQQGNDRAALLAAQVALRREGQGADTCAGLARVLTTLGDPIGAETAREKAKSFGPPQPAELDPDLKRMLDAIHEEDKRP